MISLIQVVWGLTGILDGQTKFLECSEDGLSWLRKNVVGDLFPSLHVATVIMHAVLVIIVFYRLPRLTYFADVKTIFIQESDVKTQIIIEEDEEKRIILLSTVVDSID